MKTVIAAFLKSAGDSIEITGRTLKSFKGDPTELAKLTAVLKDLKESQAKLSQAAGSFYDLRLSRLTPDGKLGGRGYVREVATIRDNIVEASRMIGEAIQSIDDEFNNPHWKQAVSEFVAAQEKQAKKEEPEESKEEKVEPLPKDAQFHM